MESQKNNETTREEKVDLNQVFQTGGSFQQKSLLWRRNKSDTKTSYMVLHLTLTTKSVLQSNWTCRGIWQPTLRGIPGAKGQVFSILLQWHFLLVTREPYYFFFQMWSSPFPVLLNQGNRSTAGAISVPGTYLVGHFRDLAKATILGKIVRWLGDVQFLVGKGRETQSGKVAFNDQESVCHLISLLQRKKSEKPFLK